MKFFITKSKIKSWFESNPETIQWIRIREFFAESQQSCIDGRSELGVIATPGGTVGEFILALSVLEKINKIHLRPSDINKVFNEYIKTTGKFYLHSDDRALERVGISQEKLLVLPKSMTERKSLLKKLTKPENIGCSHLKLIGQHSEKYQVRPELFRMVLETIFFRMWEQQDVKLEILFGEHQEVAVLNIVLAENITRDTMIPKIVPKVMGKRVFINHPQVTARARFLTTKVISQVLSPDIDLTRYYQATQKQGDRFLSLTLAQLAGQLPVFDLVFKGKQVLRVK